MANPSVAMVGSFHRALGEMRQAAEVFTESGIEVVNPLSTEPFNPNVDFVRFATDEAHLPDAAVQQPALRRIIGATTVYVVCPGGYVGKTTAYEWGFIEGLQRPAYFSDQPDDWFMRRHSEGRIVTSHQLAGLVIADGLTPLNRLEGWLR